MRKIELIDPWPGDITVAASSSLLAGAIALHFDQIAVVCTSPLRFMQSQSGTFIAVPGVDCMASLGYRLTLTTREDADLMLPSALSRKVIAPESWILSADPIIGAAAPVLLLTAMEQQSHATWAVKMRFLGESYTLAWRPELDGSVEFAPSGHRHAIDRIAVNSPAEAFGWLHPAYQHPFVLDENCWRSAHASDWPWPLRKALQSHHQPGKFYRDTMRRALIARFRQTPRLRQRLLALRYPVQVKDVPDGLIEEIAQAVQRETD
ncbi:hypothetical protein CBP36_07110 [Acidovorax carolinensis]|uniref:Uncharacterized protein n=1 Tax=Acidovorax carolinensis TaxID=553814 RepID=A0A240UAY3_9BURK|nr:hypothetical protein CBP35_11825 [Acidovorax carolinensis]ART58654.1 hypothetical protein CBP36_07110 [Acidovorax carolinensis]